MVPVESVNYLQSEFTKANKSNLRVTIYPGANHRLQHKDILYRKEFFSALSKSINAGE